MYSSQLGLDIKPLRNLHDARLSSRPGFAGHSVRRGSSARGRGLRYEARFAEHLELLFRPNKVYVGQWLSYEDVDGQTRYAQPDAFVPCRGRTLVFEAKLSQVPRAEAQLAKLYGPLLEFIYGNPCVLIQVCRSLRDGSDSFTKPSAFHLLEPSLDVVHLWHLIL